MEDIYQLHTVDAGANTKGTNGLAIPSSSTFLLKMLCVTISLDLKFIGASKIGDEITGNVKILKKTKTLYFYFVN